MNKNLRLLTCLVMLCSAGCAAKRNASVGFARGGLSSATQPSDPKAAIALDEIEPKVTLPVPATRPSGAMPPLDAIQAYAQARAALVENQRFAAINRLEAAAKLDPYSYEIQLDLGRAYQATSPNHIASDRALAAYEKAAAIRPDNLDLQYELGRQFLERNDLPRALMHLRLARLTTDYQSDRHGDVAALVDFFLARALRQSGYLAAAVQEYDRLIDRLTHLSLSSRSNGELIYFVKHPQILYTEIGELYEKNGNPAEALKAYEMALDNDKDSAELNKRVIQMTLASGQLDKAKKRAVDFVASAHGGGESIDLLKSVYGSGDVAGSTAALRTLHRRQPSDRLIFYALLDQLLAGNRASEAEQLLSSAVRDTRSDPDYIRRLFSLYQVRGDMESAMRLLVDCLADRPEALRDISGLWTELLKPTRHGRLRLATLQKMKVPTREESARLFWVSRLAEIWSRDALARSTLQQAAALKPAFPPVYRWLLAEYWNKPDWDEKQKAQASTQLADRAESDGNKALASELRGRSLLYQGDGVGAAKAFLAAESLGDHSPDLQLMFARAIFKQGNEARAEQLLWKILSDWPQFEEAYQELIGLYLQRHAQEQFVGALRKWLEAIPSSVQARLIEAAFDAQNAGPEGIAAAGEIIRNLLLEQPENFDVLRGAENFYRRFGKLDDFVVQLEAERLRNPDNREALEMLVNVFAEQNKLADAARVLDAARAAVIKDPDLLYFVAHLYERIDRKDITESLLGQIIAMDPRNASASNDLGYTWADEGRNLKRAEELVRVAVEAEPDNQSYLDSMAWVEYKRGKFAAARDYLDRAIGPANRPDPVVLDHLGDVLYRLNQPADAVKQWKRSLERLAEMENLRDELKQLRQSLLAKLKAQEAGQPVNVAPVVEMPGKSTQAKN